MTTFAITALVLIMMPGPDQALMTRNVLTGGRTAGLLTMAGGALGVATHATAAALGLSALLLASPAAFTALQVVGVGYLLWLGARSLRTARGQAEEQAPDRSTPSRASSPCRSAYLRQGFLSNATNPKVALFFVTFLPQFLPVASGSPRTDALLLSTVFAAIYVAWFGSYVLAVARLGDWLREPAVRARIERVTGLLLVGFALRLATAVH